MPVEARPGIGLASRCDVAVAHYGLNRIAVSQLIEQTVEGQVLGLFKCLLITTLEFNADGKVVAALPPPPTGHAGMPGPPRTGDELDQFAVATHEKMGRNPQSLYLAEIRMHLGIEAIGEQLDDARSAEFVGRQADGVDHSQ